MGLASNGSQVLAASNGASKNAAFNGKVVSYQPLKMHSGSSGNNVGYYIGDYGTLTPDTWEGAAMGIAQITYEVNAGTFRFAARGDVTPVPPAQNQWTYLRIKGVGFDVTYTFADASYFATLDVGTWDFAGLGLMYSNTPYTVELIR